MATRPTRKDDIGMPETHAERVSRIGAGVSPEHRAILEAALADHQSPSFNEILASIPDVGLDFEHIR